MENEVQVRSKLCLECQECCRHTLIPVAFDNEEKINQDIIFFYKCRGYTIFNFNNVVCIHVRGDCAQLTPNGCKIYDARPEACRAYDGRIDPLLKDVCKWKSLDIPEEFKKKGGE